MRQSGKRFHKTGENTNNSINTQTNVSQKKVEKTVISGFAKKENRVADVSVGQEE